MPLPRTPSRTIPLSLTSRAKALIVMCAVLIAGQAPAAPFEGASVPTSVRTLICDSNPRIVVLLANGTNIWYPANWESSKLFLATALAAKAAGQNMYYLGTDDTLSVYCTLNSARQVLGFGMED
ncbi:hypothetical protein GCM10011487_42420 [Steroidobacter agaridevorans]|uniref:Uncharacterized protein n=1 Tax=Steroidobacter agaridevorans TaxID=2695856 RepID=A0A829YHI5_9GAMM|nr:hypothetical protein [Steroidobacter agaridevorans]GFE82242.1 hypothetical protein GCM10011487_42420 [Steroidobacter agaridevorans]GFE85370.1 hypothetical protein GCM10011488_03240 [Steroidobacter agaridevorans]